MKALNRFHSLAVLIAIAGALALGGCNTVEGAGKDVQSAGKAVEDAAD
jgi:predicted small secreted protein